MNVIYELDPLPAWKVDLDVLDFPKVEYFERPTGDARVPLISGLRFVGDVSYLAHTTLIENDHDATEREELRAFLTEWNSDPRDAWVRYIQNVRERSDRATAFTMRADKWIAQLYA